MSVMAETATGAQLQILPVADEDCETQKCRLGRSTLEQLGARLGATAWVSSRDSKALCTLWPRHDNHSGYIQTSQLVTMLNQRISRSENDEKFITTQSIETVPKVSAIKRILVELVVKDYMKVSAWDKVSKDTDVKLKSVLRNIYLCSGCVVNIGQTAIGKLFGLAHVVVKEVVFTKGDLMKCGRIMPTTDIAIDGLYSAERYIQLHETLSQTTVLGGLDRELSMLKEIVQLPSQCGKKLNGFQFPKGVLLQGPPGCGKSSLVRHLARECGTYLLVLNGPEVFASRPGETEQNMSLAFTKAEIISKEGLCILFLDEVDALCPSRGRGSVERRIVSRLLSLLDRVIGIDNVTVIGATNSPGALDPAIRRPGRLEREILIGIPNLRQRESILHTLTSHTPLTADLDLSYLAESTPGFVGADLVSLVQLAHYKAVNSWQKHVQCGEQQACVEIGEEEFRSALHSIVPSTQRGSDVLVDYKPVHWHDIGGLDEVKVKLKQAVEWPLKHPEAFARLGIPRPRGILLYGPPGCAKTTLVRAAATACNVTFLAISGGQLYSPYVGDSERKLSQVFQQARAGAPSILFIDELDSVIGSRSHRDGGRGVQERVLSTLLNEMDGIGIKTDDIVRTTHKVAEGQGSNDPVKEAESEVVDNADVLVVAATNRPDMLDDAILRPGRMDRIIYVPPPDKQARASILDVHTRRIPLEGVDVDALADRTEGYTGADLEHLCREAALQALSEDGLDADKVSWTHFDHVLSSMKPSLTPDQLLQYSKIKGH